MQVNLIAKKMNRHKGTNTADQREELAVNRLTGTMISLSKSLSSSCNRHRTASALRNIRGDGTLRLDDEYPTPVPEDDDPVCGCLPVVGRVREAASVFGSIVTPSCARARRSKPFAPRSTHMQLSRSSLSTYSKDGIVEIDQAIEWNKEVWSIETAETTVK